MKKLFSIIMVCVLMFTMSACTAKEIEMPKKDLPEYPEVDTVDGYSISGTVKDLSGNGLVGASISINDKIMAITDENGDYKIKSVKGSSEVSVSFYDYQFRNDTRTVNNYTTDLDFEGSSNFKITAKTKTMNGAGLYGVTYDISGEVRSEDAKGIAYKINNTGKTTITPNKKGFTFYPKSVDLYTGNEGDPYMFTAIPDEDTFAVSGSLTFLDDSSMPEIVVYVNGIKHTNTVLTKQDNAQKITYTIYGLPETEGVGYNITTGSGYDGYISTTNYLVNSERTGVNFDMLKAKTVDVTLSFLGGGVSSDMSYYVKVSDKNRNEVARYDFNNSGEASGIVVFEGCRIEVVSRRDEFTSSIEVVSKQFMDNNFAKNITVECIKR